MTLFYRFVRYWSPVCLLMAIIYGQSSFATPDVLPHWSNLDKVLHAGVYGLLGALICRAFNSLPRWQGRMGPLMAAGMVLATLYGLSDEWHQSFVSVRTADVADLLADLVGSGLGGLAYLGIFARLNRLSPSK